MAEYDLNPQKQPLFYISRLLILIGMIITALLAFTILGFMISAFFFDLSLLKDPDALSNPTDEIMGPLKVIQLFTAIGCFIAPALMFPKALERHSMSFLKMNRGFNPLLIVIFFLIVLCANPLISWMMELNQSLDLPQYFKDMEIRAAKLTKMFLQADNIGDLLLNLLVVAIVPAIGEEMLFRGTLQPFFHSWFKNIHVAIIVTAIVFSAIHMQFYGFLPRMAMGLMLGYLVYWTGSLWAPMLAHFFNNAIAVLLSYMDPDSTKYPFLQETYEYPWYAAIISAVLLAIFILIIKRFSPKHVKLDQDI